MLQLIDYTTPQNALLVYDYPYHFGAYTCVKYWVETNPSYGQRSIHQFLDPKSTLANPHWFKPKSSGFSDIVVMQVQNDRLLPQFGSVSIIAFDFAGKAKEEVQGFSEYFYFDESQREILVKQLGTYRGSVYRTNFRNKPAPWVPLCLQPMHSQPIVAPTCNIFKVEDDTPLPPHTPEQFQGTLGTVAESVQQLPQVSDDVYAAAELVKETWEGWPFSRIQEDPEGWAAHRTIRDNAYVILGLEIPGAPAALSFNDLKRGG